MPAFSVAFPAVVVAALLVSGLPPEAGAEAGDLRQRSEVGCDTNFFRVAQFTYPQPLWRFFACFHAWRMNL